MADKLPGNRLVIEYEFDSSELCQEADAYAAQMGKGFFGNPGKSFAGNIVSMKTSISRTLREPQQETRQPNTDKEEFRYLFHGTQWTPTQQALMKDPDNKELQQQVQREKDAQIDAWRKESRVHPQPQDFQSFTGTCPTCGQPYRGEDYQNGFKAGYAEGRKTDLDRLEYPQIYPAKSYPISNRPLNSTASAQEQRSELHPPHICIVQPISPNEPLSAPNNFVINSSITIEELARLLRNVNYSRAEAIPGPYSDNSRKEGRG